MAFTGSQPQQAELHQHPQQRGPGHRIWHRPSRRVSQGVACPRQTCLALLAHMVHHHRLHSVDPQNQAVQTCQASTLDQPCNGAGARHVSLPQQHPAQPEPGGAGSWQQAAGLTRKIKTCSNTQQLQRLLEKHGLHTLNHIHATAIATRTAQLLAEEKPNNPITGSTTSNTSVSAASWALLLQLLHVVGAHLDRLDARGVANVLWSLASIANSLGLRPQQQLTPGSMPGVQQPELQQRQVPWPVQADMVNGSGNHNSAVTPLNGATCHAASIEQSVSCAEQGTQLQCSELFDLLHSMGSTLLTRAAHLGWHRCNVQQLSNTLWAAATLGLQLSPHQGERCLMAVVGKTGQHATGSEPPLTAQGFSSIVWACAHLNLTPSRQLISLGPSVMSNAQPQAFSNVLWGVAQLSIQPPNTWVARLLALARPSLPHFSSQALANTAWALARLQHRPPQPWLHDFMAACDAQLASMSPRHLASIIWALSCMSQQQETAAGQQSSTVRQDTRGVHVPQAWLCSVADHVQPSLSTLQPQELSMISSALAELGWLPTPAWTSSWVAAVRCMAAAASMQSQSLSCCAAAAAQWLQLLHSTTADSAASTHRDISQPLQALLNEACLQLAAHARDELAAQRQQQEVLLVNHVNGYSADSVQLQPIALQQHRILAKKGVALNGMTGGHAGTAVSSTGLGTADAWLQLLTVLSAAQWQTLKQWQTHCQGRGLSSVAQAAMQYAVAQQKLSSPQVISLCWALAKLGVVPKVAWRQQVVVPLIEHCCNQLQLPDAIPQLTPKELSLLVWSCNQWGMAEACLPLTNLQGQWQLLDAGGSSDAAGHEGSVSAAAALQPLSAQQQHGSQLEHPSPSLIAMSLVTLATHWHSSASNKLLSFQPMPPLAEDGSCDSSQLDANARGAAYTQRQVATARSLLRQAGQLASLPAGHPHALSATDLCRCLWAAARMDYRPSATWASAVQGRLLQLLQADDAQAVISHLPLCMWSLAKLHVIPPPMTAAQLLHVCLHAVGHPLVDPHHPERLLCVLSACKLWRMQPGMQWWRAVFNDPAWAACVAVLSHSQLPPWCMLSPSEGAVTALVSMQLSSFLSLAGTQHLLSSATSSQQYASAVAGASVPDLQHVTGWRIEDLQRTLQVLVGLQVQPTEAWLQHVRGAVLQQLLPNIVNTFAQRELSRRQQEVPAHFRQRVRLNGRQVHLLALSLQLLSAKEEQQLHSPAVDSPVPWLAAALSAAELCIPYISLGSMCSLLLACTRYARTRPVKQLLEDVVEAILRNSQPVLQQATSAQLLRLLRALAAVHARPAPDWATSLHATLQPRLHQLSDEQLAVLLPLLVDARCRPNQHFLIAYLHVVTPKIVPQQVISGQGPVPRRPATAPYTSPTQPGTPMPSPDSQPAKEGPTVRLSDAPVRRALAPAQPQQQSQQQASGIKGQARGQGPILQQPAYLSAMLSALHWADPRLCMHWRAQVGLHYQ